MLKEKCIVRLSKALEMDTCSVGASLVGNIEGHSIPRAFDRREKLLYFGKLL
jgi:hypothetical protein